MEIAKKWGLAAPWSYTNRPAEARIPVGPRLKSPPEMQIRNLGRQIRAWKLPNSPLAHEKMAWPRPSCKKPLQERAKTPTYAPAYSKNRVKGPPFASI